MEQPAFGMPVDADCRDVSGDTVPAKHSAGWLQRIRVELRRKM
jgi:hypothetical protein